MEGFIARFQPRPCPKGGGRQKKPAPRRPKGLYWMEVLARLPGVGEAAPTCLRHSGIPSLRAWRFPRPGRKGRSLMRNSFLVHYLYEFGRTAIAFPPWGYKA